MKISFDDLELGPLIGSGTVGAVYRCKLKTTGETVAVKILLAAISEDKLVRARFKREMAILERLCHPNIVHYFGGGEHDGQLFYAMEPLDCGTLKELLNRFGTLTWREVASIARQVCSGLQHAHNQGIIHRDLKPGNLFLTQDGQIKLGDFGIARDTYSADLTSEGLTVGTHAYMPPEQIVGEANITGKADLYSLGCVLFELLTGNKPFQGTNFAVLFEQHLRTEAPKVSDFVPDCPEKLVDLVARLLAKNPDDRPFNARAVQGVMIDLLAQDWASSAAERGSAIQDPNELKLEDVGAASVVDSGMKSLASKLTYPSPQHANIPMLILFGVLIAALAAVVAFMSK